MLCHTLPPCFFPHSKSHSVSFFALMWPEVERRSTSKCVGPSIIPPCKYLHKETSRLALAKKRESRPWASIFCRAIYSYEPSRANKGARWGREGKDERAENEKVGQFILRDGSQKKEDRWTGGFGGSKKGWGRLQSSRGRLRATALTHRADVRHHWGVSNTL